MEGLRMYFKDAYAAKRMKKDKEITCIINTL